jgi:hypothetical protein
VQSIDRRQVGVAFITGLLPGGRLARSAAAAAGQVIINYLDALEDCEEYTPGAALRDFAVGIGLELIGEKAGELVAEYGIRAVRAGFKRLGFDEAFEDALRKLDDVDVNLPCKNSFSAETEVVTEEGNQPIGTLEEGDVVLAYDEETGEIDYYPVIATISHEDPVVEYLTIDGETVVTTPNHPFYTDAGEWVNAGELQAGDRIRRADGSDGTVEAVTFVYAPQPMYNLTVATAHTYFIGDGEWLVHNCKWLGPDPDSPPAFGEILASHADDIHGQITQYWARRNSTTAVANVDGKMYVASFGDARAATELKDLANQRGYEFIPSQGEHAEITLFRRLQNEPGFNGIGVSHWKGPCPSCRSFFRSVDFENVFWTNLWKP